VILSAGGREVGAAEIAHAREVVRLCFGLSRKELARTLCYHWDWLGATGKPQLRACAKLLEKLEKLGMLELPPKQQQGRQPYWRGGKPALGERTEPQSLIECRLKMVQPIHLERVEGDDATGLWNEFVERYHPLGFKPPFGCSLRYFVVSRRGRVGCILLASAARALRCRDEWIGWSVGQRLQNLPWVINNSRFVLFPWVRVPHLASHVLGQLARRVQDDWEARWSYRPVLMETFVDPEHFRGVSYRAAGWLRLGETTGRGLELRGHSYTTTPKLVFVHPLARDFRARLCSLNNVRTPES
jgi:hypothetical protein